MKTPGSLKARRRKAIRAILSLLATLSGFSMLESMALPEKPNVVLILLDDVGYGDLGCYGSQVHHTHHIDSLASEGTRFTDFHSNAPVCSPTRAALLTGQYQQRSGIESAIGFVEDEGMPLKQITIAEMLAENGYTCGVFGKWHVGHVSRYGPNDQGFDQSICSNNSPDYHTHVSRVGELDWFKNHELYREPGYLTHLVSKHTEEFIETNRDKPFFAFVSHLAVHFPYQGPNDPPLRAVGQIWHDQKYGPLPKEDYKRAYDDMLAEADRSVGAVIDTLERLDLRRKTLILVTSDNGAYSWVGSNGSLRGGKGDLMEGGHRVPAIANWPDVIPAGIVSEFTAATMDLAPTILAFTGSAKPPQVRFDGIDLAPAILADETLPPRTLFWRFNNSYTDSHARAVRKGRWKYVVEDQEAYLFDLALDLGERNNLAAELPHLVSRLKQSYISWEKELEMKN